MNTTRPTRERVISPWTALAVGLALCVGFWTGVAVAIAHLIG